MAERPDFHALIVRNRRATWLLLFVFFLLLAAVGVAAGLAIGGGLVAVVIGVVVSGFVTFASFRSSKRLALRATRARPASYEEYRQLHNVIETVSIAAGVPKPEVWIVDDSAPNAFATGHKPEDAAVAATTGLLAKLDRDELEGVMAHEVAHIRNHDILVMTVAAATAGAIAMIADLFWRFLYFGALTGGGRRRSRDSGNNGLAGLLALLGFLFVTLLAPLAAVLLKAAVSRRREALADATAVEITRYPTGLREALEKLDADSTVVRRVSHATSHLWIETPDDHEQGHRGRRFNDLYNTHPPLRERIDLLRAIEGLQPYTGPDPALVASLRDTAIPPAAGGGPAAAAATAASLTGGPTSSSATRAAVGGGSSPTAGTGAVAATVGAGWFPDPSGEPGLLRYWDGTAWTGHVYRT